MSDHIQKIRQIIAHAQSTSNENEAETFMAKAHALLKAHGLSLSDIPASDDPMGHQDKKTASAWQRDLLTAVARYFYCDAVIYRNLVTVFGRDSARITTLEMWPYVLKSVGEKAKVLRSNYRMSSAVARRQVGRALEMVLCQMIAERKLQAECDPTGPGLVPVNDLKAYQDETWPELGVHSGRAQPTSLQAVELAREINLDEQLRGEQRLLT